MRTAEMQPRAAVLQRHNEDGNCHQIGPKTYERHVYEPASDPLPQRSCRRAARRFTAAIAAIVWELLCLSAPSTIIAFVPSPPPNSLPVGAISEAGSRAGR